MKSTTTLLLSLLSLLIAPTLSTPISYPPASPFDFDATFSLIALPDQVVSNTSVPVPGQPSARAYYSFGLQASTNTICYNITLLGVTGEYLSPALTATHVHESARGKSGPPRIVFPNPVGDDKRRISVGCLTGPFRTGILVAGKDTGEGFHVKKIVDAAEGFNADVHTRGYPAGAVRGQFETGRGACS